MIGNNDIFDEEELLAIAADGGDGSSSSSSSCHSMSAEDEDNKSSRSQSSSRSKTAALTKNNATLPNAGHGEEGNNCSSSSDDDDSDDGFLESWFKTEKKVLAAQSRVGDEDSKDDATVTQKSDPDKSTDNVKTNTDHGTGGHRIELGDGIVRWISSATEVNASSSRPGKSSTSTPSVVAIQHNIDEHDDASTRSSMLRLTTTASADNTNPRKRARSGNEYANKATIEEITANGSTMDKTMICGQVAYASDAAQRMTTPGAMVDCLARYDSQKGCYVLEMVDLMVTKLEPLSKAAYDEQMLNTATAGASVNTASAVHSPQNENHLATEVLFDPRSTAKRADDKIRKLRQGKGRAGGEVPKKKNKNRVPKMAT